MSDTIKQSYRDPYVTGPINVTKVSSEDKVTYDVRDKIVRTGESEHDFVIEKEVYEKQRVSVKDYIRSFEGDVGLDNILKKLAITGDTTIREGMKDNGKVFIDTRKLPTNNMEVDDLIREGNAKAKELGIKLTKADIDAYVQRAVLQAMADKKAAEEKAAKGEEK